MVRPRGFESHPSQGGFALLVVVVLLFAVGVTAAATYQLVLGESRLASFNRDAERAQLVAEAGALRLIGDAVDGPPPDMIYDFGGGGAQARVAEVSARKVLEDAETWTELWRVRSIGRVTDPRLFDFPAVREVSRYARMRAPPFERLGAVMTARTGPPSGDAVNVGGGFDLSGDDDADPDVCPHQGGTIARIAANGSCPECINYNGNLLGAMGIPAWNVFTHTDYRADHPVTGSGWTFSALSVPADSFPSIRVQGDLTTTSSHSGRGALIVTGQLSFGTGFTWDGIILAGRIQNSVDAPGMEVRGTVIEVNPPGAAALTLSSGSIRYHSCNVAAAGTSIGVLNPEGSAWWSVF